MLQNGGRPLLWFDKWVAAKRISQEDRIYHEVLVLVRCLDYAATFDCLNIGVLACLEIVAKRLYGLIVAYKAVPHAKANWDLVNDYEGFKGLDEDICEELEEHVAKRVRERTAVQSVQLRARQLKAGSPALPGDDGADLGGLEDGLPTKRGGGRGRGRRGRGLAAPPES